MERETVDCVVFVLVAADGSWAVGDTGDEARERWDSAEPGPLGDQDGFRIVQATIRVPLPVLATLMGTAPDEGEATLAITP